MSSWCQLIRIVSKDFSKSKPNLTVFKTPCQNHMHTKWRPQRSWRRFLAGAAGILLGLHSVHDHLYPRYMPTLTSSQVTEPSNAEPHSNLCYTLGRKLSEGSSSSCAKIPNDMNAVRKHEPQASCVTTQSQYCVTTQYKAQCQ